jgi:tetratricopeptide (TPR) repeat protein
MNSLPSFARSCFVWVCIAVLLVRPSAQAVTNSEPVTPDVSSVASSNANEALRAFLQLQEQIHLTQLSLERDRKESREAAAALREAVIGQRERELNAMQNTNSLLLRVAAGFGVIGFLAMVVTAFLQWRAVTRLAEVAAMLPGMTRPALPGAGETAATPLISNAATEQSSQRLFGALSQLEKRIHELEHTSHPAAPESGAVTATGTNGNGSHGTTLEAPEKEKDSPLLARAQSLLDLEKGDQALGVINEILLNDPTNAEVLVKKGIAHEQLRQLDEALRCYERAIELNGSLTIAYLQKGGLFNRMERYEEALQCYEQALRAQEKAHHA